MNSIDRRRFLTRTAAGVGALSTGLLLTGPAKPQPEPLPNRVPYKGPNVIIVRFGGGVRRRETVEFPDQTYCPFLLHELAPKQGVLFNNVEIENNPGVDTSHGQGTLYIMTGQYRHYVDVFHQPFADRFVPASPTVFEYLRRKYDLPDHQALIVNGEDRINEEFYTFSNDHLHGVNYRSRVLSLFSYKTFLLRDELRDKDESYPQFAQKKKKLEELEKHDYRVPDQPFAMSKPITDFWTKWRDHYGQSGFVNPRGDRLLTTLSLWAMRELRPRLLMINYQDPDYVHWGNPQFYTRAVSIIDDGIRELYEAAQANEFYRDNTVFVVVPDCGRDNNRTVSVPFQHHFNSKSAHEVFVVVAGPGIRGKGQKGSFTITSRQQQTSIARAVGDLMGFDADQAEAPSLLDVI
jgi:hypothetical protein